MNITLYSILPLISSLIVLICGIFIYSRKVATRVLLSMVCFSAFIWLFGYSLMYASIDEITALKWARIGYNGVFFIPVFFYHFTIKFLQIKRKKLVLYLHYLIGLTFLISNQTPLFLEGMFQNYFWGNYPKVGILYPFFIFYFFGVFLRCFMLFYKVIKFQKGLSPIQRNRIKYVFLAFSIAGFLGIFDYIPNYGIEVYPVGYIGAVIWVCTVTYAILKYHLMDIHIAIKRTAVYSLCAGLLTGLFVVLVLSITKLFSTFTQVDSFKISIFAALIIALLFNPLRNRIQILIDKVFYKKTYDYYATIRKVSHELATKFDLKEIYSFVGDVVFSTLGLKNIYLLSASSAGGYRVVYHTSYKKSEGKGQKAEYENNKNEIKIIDENSEIIKLFNTLDEVVIKDELPAMEKTLGQETIEHIKGNLESFQGEVAVPVFVDDKLTLLIILGEKLSGDMFTNEDINLLNTISDQTAIALKNAELYKEKVNSEKLASIGMMSATFAHAIKNPLTSLKTFAQLMPEKYTDAEFRNTFSKIVMSEVEKIDGLIEDLLDFSTKKISAGVDNFDITALVDETLEYVKGKLGLEKKNIRIEKNYKNIKINMSGNVRKLKEAFINIINNGCQAMQENGVLRVSINPDGENVDITITDTGRGIPPEDIDKIFDPFYTTKPLGVGLGLAISKKIIENHGGKIKVESKLSKGTTFIISLPMNKKF